MVIKKESIKHKVGSHKPKATKVVKKAATSQKSKNLRPKIQALSSSGRGRPKKEFKLHKKRIEIETLASQPIYDTPRSHKILNFPNRDRSILYLFIFSIILFIFSIGISFIKNDKQKQLKDLTSTQEIGIIQTGIQEEEIIKEKITIDAKQTILNFYQAINIKNFDLMNQMININLKNSNTFRTYYTSKRLTRFVDNLSQGAIQIQNIQDISDENSNIKTLTFTLIYTLITDNKTYIEDRNITLIKKSDETQYQIAKIMCETTGCSRMPFFNPGKYNIK